MHECVRETLTQMLCQSRIHKMGMIKFIYVTDIFLGFFAEHLKVLYKYYALLLSL